nr:NAD-dependent epimerase/dehydratase family protein [Lachnospiraceae bacterium]
MKRILITGFSGFVSRHFLNYLYDNKKEYHVLGADINEPKLDMDSYKDVLDISFKQCNMLDEKAVNEMVEEFAPDYVLHLAAFSSVAYSWKHPGECFDNNTRIFLNITDAVRALKK